MYIIKDWQAKPEPSFGKKLTYISLETISLYSDEARQSGRRWSSLKMSDRSLETAIIIGVTWSTPMFKLVKALLEEILMLKLIKGFLREEF